jgi:hypothetical protein
MKEKKEKRKRSFARGDVYSWQLTAQEKLVLRHPHPVVRPTKENESLNVLSANHALFVWAAVCVV